MDFGDVLSAVGGWSNVGAGALLVLVVAAILRGLLIPRGLIAREDSQAAIERVAAQADARVADAHARVAEALDRAERAEQREERWRDAWLVSEAGRRLAAEQSAGVVAATVPLTSALTSAQAVRGLHLPPQPPDSQ